MYCYAECHYAERRYAECHGALLRYRLLQKYYTRFLSKMLLFNIVSKKGITFALLAINIFKVFVPTMSLIK